MLPHELWVTILDHLSFRDASRSRRACKAINKAVVQRDHIDLSECDHLLQARVLLRRSPRTLRHTQLTVPMVAFLETFQSHLRRFRRINLSGARIPLESMLTKLPLEWSMLNCLSHLTITNGAFVNTESMPDGTVEDYFTFDLSALEYASNLQVLHLHFDRIVQAITRYDHICGAWLKGLDRCPARDVRIVVESPPFTSLKGDLPPYGTGAHLKDRMAFRVNLPRRAQDLYILTDCVLWLGRPTSHTPWKPDEENDRRVLFRQSFCQSCGSKQHISATSIDPSEIINLCILSVKRIALDIPNTQIRRILPNLTAKLQRPLICVTSKSTPDHIYAESLSRFTPGHCDLEQAEEIPVDSWDDE